MRPPVLLWGVYGVSGCGERPAHWQAKRSTASHGGCRGQEGEVMCASPAPARDPHPASSESTILQAIAGPAPMDTGWHPSAASSAIVLSECPLCCWLPHHAHLTLLSCSWHSTALAHPTTASRSSPVARRCTPAWPLLHSPRSPCCALSLLSKRLSTASSVERRSR